MGSHYTSNVNAVLDAMALMIAQHIMDVNGTALLDKARKTGHLDVLDWTDTFMSANIMAELECRVIDRVFPEGGM